MSWILEHMHVHGTYLNEFDVQGIVTLSRVKYGGKVSHHVKLDNPITVYGALRDTVILDHEDIKQVRGHHNV